MHFVQWWSGLFLVLYGSYVFHICLSIKLGLLIIKGYFKGKLAFQLIWFFLYPQIQQVEMCLSVSNMQQWASYAAILEEAAIPHPPFMQALLPFVYFFSCLYVLVSLLSTHLEHTQNTRRFGAAKMQLFWFMLLIIYRVYGHSGLVAPKILPLRGNWLHYVLTYRTLLTDLTWPAEAQPGPLTAYLMNWKH